MFWHLFKNLIIFLNILHKTYMFAYAEILSGKVSSPSQKSSGWNVRVRGASERLGKGVHVVSLWWKFF